jgi:threonyl-tRNA synthetase
LRVLQLHVERFSYTPISEEIKDAEKAEKKEVTFSDGVVLFTSIEKQDDSEVAENAAEEIAASLKVISVGSVMLYPYSHLSSELASPADAKSILDAMEKALRKTGLNVHRAPFGWNKSFGLQIKGHPLAEQAKSFRRIEKKQKAEPKEKFKKFIVIDESGEEEELDAENLSKSETLRRKGQRYSLLKTFVTNELIGKESKTEQPAHVRLMTKLGLIDHSPESDVGHMKWYPNGILIKDLMMDYALNNIALKLGAMKMQNPLLYRTEVEEIKKLQGEFHERDYIVKEDGSSFVLRFASDPGAFPFVQKLNISYRNMPVRLYEEAICFRKEQSGEVSGLLRLRNFWMTDMHSFLANEKQALEEFEQLTVLYARLMNEIISSKYWVLGFEVVEEYYEKYRDLFKKVVKQVGVPALFKLMKEMTHYYAFKNEFQAIYADGDNVQISTVQWDIKNGERFHIEFTNEQGRKIPVPFIIHAASFGSIERALGALLESAAWMEKEGALPSLPLWLSPEQVRVVPVSSEKHLQEGNKVAEMLDKTSIRVGVDDRNIAVGKKIFDARTSWIPFVVVLGDKEIASKKLSVTIRSKSMPKAEHREEMTADELVQTIKDQTKGMPFRPMYVPRQVSERIDFGK